MGQLVARHVRAGGNPGAKGLPKVPGTAVPRLAQDKARPLESDVRRAVLLPRVVSGYK